MLQFLCRFGGFLESFWPDFECVCMVFVLTCSPCVCLIWLYFRLVVVKMTEEAPKKTGGGKEKEPTVKVNPKWKTEASEGMIGSSI